ncbi:hypothetical protein D3C73_1443290 [compost metagenome]
MHRIPGNDNYVARMHLIKGLIDEKASFAAIYVDEFVPVMLVVGQLALRAFRFLIVQQQRKRQLMVKMPADRFHDVAP